MEFYEKLRQLNWDDKYDASVEYMQKAGLKFTDLKPDHTHNKMRYFINGSSFFVKKSFYRFHLCEEDKQLMDKYPE